MLFESEMTEGKHKPGGVERGPNAGVPGGARRVRPVKKVDTPLTPEELAKFSALLGPQGQIPEAPPERAKLKAVVIDDEPDFRFFELRALEKLEIEAVPASDGKDGLLKIAQEKPDLILLDLKMPEMDGYEVLRGVRTYLGFKKVMIFVMTSSASRNDEVAAFGLGADDFLVKPVNREKFAAKMDAVNRRILDNKKTP